MMFVCNLAAYYVADPQNCSIIKKKTRSAVAEDGSSSITLLAALDQLGNTEECPFQNCNEQ